MEKVVKTHIGGRIKNEVQIHPIVSSLHHQVYQSASNDFVNILFCQDLVLINTDQSSVHFAYLKSVNCAVQ